MVRKFVYDGKAYDDPNPELSVDQVREHMANFYTELTTAETLPIRTEGDDQIYEFKRKVGTKGGAVAVEEKEVVQEETRNEDLDSLEVLARLMDVEIETKEICDKWLLITYDLPHTEEGDRARRVFLDNARLIGATKHTESVYLMPWTGEAEVLALNLSGTKGGRVCLWTSQPTDTNLAVDITKAYDASLRPQIDAIGVRIDKIVEHQNEDRWGRAAQMMEKTKKMLDGMEQAVLRRASAQLYVLITLLKRRFALL